MFIFDIIHIMTKTPKYIIIFDNILNAFIKEEDRMKAIELEKAYEPKSFEDRIYKEWLPTADYERILDYDIENYLPGDSSSPDYVCEICLPVRKK